MTKAALPSSLTRYQGMPTIGETIYCLFLSVSITRKPQFNWELLTFSLQRKLPEVTVEARCACGKRSTDGSHTDECPLPWRVHPFPTCSAYLVSALTTYLIIHSNVPTFEGWRMTAPPYLTMNCWDCTIFIVNHPNVKGQPNFCQINFQINLNSVHTAPLLSEYN